MQYLVGFCTLTYVLMIYTIFVIFREYFSEFVCVSCMTKAPYRWKTFLNCGHKYCKDCVIRMFQVAEQSKRFAPPRCCGIPLTLDHVRWFLDSSARQKLVERWAEFTDKYPLWCSNAECGAYIRLGRPGDDSRKCSHCGQATCTTCEKVYREGCCAPPPCTKCDKD
ncbi:hypothetical protein FE257_006127 [Aspergillus nanangensis]|uniref:IBR domain-containing protein n=1 Tax=Aspergillus nanangensis TaxID=2582783 RepID=A0AAD4GV16_ASPNN|nr:hypothetical protein FE257_006127 [Aspergillus nanangensis]